MHFRMNSVLLLVVMVFGTVGCGTLSKANDVLSWANTKFAQVDSTIAGVKEKYDAKIAKIELKQAQDVAKLEVQLGHALDLDANGKVDLAEAKQAYMDLIRGAMAGDQEKKEALFDPTTLLTILMSLLGVGGVGTALHKSNKNGTQKAVEEALAKVTNGNGSTTT